MGSRILKYSDICVHRILRLVKHFLSGYYSSTGLDEDELISINFKINDKFNNANKTEIKTQLH